MNASRSSQAVPVTLEEAQILDVIQGGRCFFCGGLIGTKATFDHLIPQSYGGADVVGNVVLAHRRCNQLKNDRLPFVAELDLLVRQRRGGRIGIWPPLLALKEALEQGADDQEAWVAVARAISDCR